MLIEGGRSSREWKLDAALFNFAEDPEAGGRPQRPPSSSSSAGAYCSVRQYQVVFRFCIDRYCIELVRRRSQRAGEPSVLFRFPCTPTCTHAARTATHARGTGRRPSFPVRCLERAKDMFSSVQFLVQFQKPHRNTPKSHVPPDLTQTGL